MVMRRPRLVVVWTDADSMTPEHCTDKDRAMHRRRQTAQYVDTDRQRNSDTDRQSSTQTDDSVLQVCLLTELKQTKEKGKVPKPIPAPL